MKKDAAKPVDLSVEMSPRLNDELLESIAGGEEPGDRLTLEEAQEIVRRNVEWNLQNGCTTDPESQKTMVESWMKKSINRAELEKRGGIAYYFPK